MSRRSLLVLVLASASALAVGPGPSRVAGATESPAAVQNAEGRLHVLLLNGGGSPRDNFASHAAHLDEMAELLDRSGVPRERVSILAADGTHPDADLAMRNPDPEKIWLLEGTGLLDDVAEPLTFESTRFPEGLAVEPATRESVRRWFQQASARLSPGDTLLLFVTDHGRDGPRDPRNNEITLWGRRQAVTVRELTRQIEQLGPGIRVVAVMSQCFSGGFAHILEAGQDPAGPTGAACGYFSTTADRPAYGCYPESGNGERIGHAFAMIDALRATGSLSQAHRRTLLGDHSPDVPLRSLDIYHAESLRALAAQSGLSLEGLVLRWLERPASGPKLEPELALAARVARIFDVTDSLDLKALDRQGAALESSRQRFEKLRELWATGLADMAAGNFNAFLRANPAWQRRLDRRNLRRLPDEQRRAERAALLEALEAFARAAGDYSTLVSLVDKTDQAAAAAYRTEVRQAALLRRRVLLVTAAGRRRLAAEADAEQRRRAQALEACHELELEPTGQAKTRRGQAPTAHSVEPLISLEKDRRRLADLTPAWLGIAFAPTPTPVRRRFGLDPGAVTVTQVAPGSPAAAAGLARGDVVLGAAGTRFRHPGEIRVTAMLAPREKPWRIELLRAGRRLALSASLSPYPER